MVPETIHVGTSGWSYSDWTGVFYPPDLPDSERLSYYASQFDTVEINSTFYRFPPRTMITAWNRRLPTGFHLVVKGTRRVTHFQKLVDCQEVLRAFLERVGPLQTLRVLLWQLPPSLHQDLQRLEGFLQLLGQEAPGVRHAVEFRHSSWWSEETAALLGRYRMAFVAVSHPKLPADVLPTTDFLYVRFHGLGKQLYRYNYSHQELAEWVQRLRPYLAGRTLYAFFNNDYEAFAPRNAMAFRQMLADALTEAAKAKRPRR
ncbi:MAG: DUF72 domain-containing protein [Thermoguttaceae bacterium]|nr:DUF72 domain-containing protein [Thermoguttaceae bacterium]MDW8039365.1 DUF72 domain-containing protein [Thermoguttaceae bacterium]